MLSVLAVALTPRPRRTCRELVRVLKVGGTLALAVPTRARARRDRDGAWPARTPRWGAAEDARAYLEPLWVDTRDHPLRLGFESMDAAVGGVRRAVRDARRRRGAAFEAEVAERSPGARARSASATTGCSRRHAGRR